MHSLEQLISDPWFWVTVVFSVVGALVLYVGHKVGADAEKLLPPSDFKEDIFGDIVKRYKAKVDSGHKIVMAGVAIEAVCALGVCVITGLENAALNNKAGDAEREAGQANERSSTNELQVEELKSNNLALSIELEKLKHPRIITADQRQRFIDILSLGYNYSKTRIEVIDGDPERPTEYFAFQIRRLLDETGYGSETSKYQLPIIEMSSNSVTACLQPPHMELPPFDVSEAIVTKITGFSILPLPLKHTPVFTITNAGFMYTSENPFTDKEPNIIAIFSGEIPSLNFRPTNSPSVFVAYPSENFPVRTPVYFYVPTKDPNSILYGLCEVFHEVGITVGETTNNDIVAPGHVGFFIPQR